MVDKRAPAAGVGAGKKKKKPPSANPPAARKKTPPVVVQTLYNLGARKFAVIDVAPIGCCPYWRSRNPAGECVEPLNRLAKSLNDGLQDLFVGLSSEMQGMEYAIGSSYELVSSIVEDPQSAGLTELKSTCCGGGGRFNADGGCTPIAGYCGDRGKFGLPAPYPGHLQARWPSVLRRAGAVRRSDHLQGAGRGVGSQRWK